MEVPWNISSKSFTRRSGVIFSSWILDSAIFPTWVNLFLQRDDSTGQPMGGYIDFGQTALFQGVNHVSQGCDMGMLEEVWMRGGHDGRKKAGGEVLRQKLIAQRRRAQGRGEEMVVVEK
jgi:hypothetical protein